MNVFVIFSLAYGVPGVLYQHVINKREWKESVLV